MAQSYRFLGAGRGIRWEQFGKISVSRPCPIANRCWSRQALPGDLKFDNNTWEKSTDDAQLANWKLGFGRCINFNLSLSAQGQVGVFPEQQGSWKFIYETLARHSHFANIKLLNGFAHTGGSTMAALSIPNVEVFCCKLLVDMSNYFTQVVHLDASKSACNRAALNLQTNECKELEYAVGRVRWQVQDCMSYLQREVARGSKYHALVFDPPAFGRGFVGSGRRGRVTSWQLDRDLPVLLSLLPQLLVCPPRGSFCSAGADRAALVLVTCHDPRWPSHRLARALAQALSSSTKSTHVYVPLTVPAGGQDSSTSSDSDSDRDEGSVSGGGESHQLPLQVQDTCDVLGCLRVGSGPFTGVVEYGTMTLSPACDHPASSASPGSLHLGVFARWLPCH